MTTAKVARADEVLDIDELAGVWKRSLLIDSTGHRDDTSHVTWLQACSVFIDVRQRVDRPSFDDISGGRAMNARQRGWTHAQQGFAGTVVMNDGVFERERAIDLHPPPAHADAGRFAFDGNVLVETGHVQDYLELWVRDAHPLQPEWALRLCGTDGRSALLARIGDAFGWARGRPAQMTAHDHFLDCEYAIGRIEDSRWQITTSTLPFREGADLCARLTSEGLVTADVTENGHPVERHWTVQSTQGSVQL